MDFKQMAKDLVAKMTLAEKMAQMKYNAPAIERLNVPEYNWWNEALHGVARSGAATVFPQSIGMAATFDPELINRVSTAISDEARAKYNEYKKFGGTDIYQGLTYWSPNINIFRDPRWGRGHETYGEDPFLTGSIGLAFVKGLQDGDGTYRKLDATLKHYAVHSGPEALRHSFDARVNQKDLWETYLAAFEYCLENTDIAAVMGAYNRTNGEPCCASKTLLGDILRGKLGFKGYVVSDCGAINDFNAHHKITNDKAESAALAVNNGCDLNCGFVYEMLKVAYDRGLVTEEKITESVERLFEARFRLGMFDENCSFNKIPYSVVECEEHTALNRKVAQDTMVLLKNEGILPLKKDANIAVIGPNADDKSVLLGNYNGTPSKYCTLLRGIQEASHGRVYYAKGCERTGRDPGPWAEHPTNEAILAAKRSDVVVMIMGINPDMEGEQSDTFNGVPQGDDHAGRMEGDKDRIELPRLQNELYEKILATGKPIVFVNVSGSCMALTRQAETADAILQCFYPGAQGGYALADILFGDVSPSGRLPVTFYRQTADLPDFEDYAMVNRTYRYYTGEPLYPFGWGLSYSEFDYECMIEDDVVREDEDLYIDVELTNLGRKDAAEVIEVFLEPKNPGNDPIIKLIGFQKEFVRAGETKFLTLMIPAQRLLYVNENGEKYFRKGEYTLKVGQIGAFKCEAEITFE